MNLLLIDPTERTVTEVEYSGDYKELYGLLDCRTFDVVRGEDFDMYIDDEGLYAQNPQSFMVSGWQYPIFGKAVVCASNKDGETIPANVTLSQVEQDIFWIDCLMKMGAHIFAQQVGTGRIRRVPS